jgi:hypothetical protein
MLKELNRRLKPLSTKRRTLQQKVLWQSSKTQLRFRFNLLTLIRKRIEIEKSLCNS